MHVAWMFIKITKEKKKNKKNNVYLYENLVTSEVLKILFKYSFK